MEFCDLAVINFTGFIRVELCDVAGMRFAGFELRGWLS